MPKQIGLPDVASRISALLPEPDEWAVAQDPQQRRLLSLTGRSLFVLWRGDGQQLAFGRAVVTEDGDTLVSFTESRVPDGWLRSWHIDFHKKPRDSRPSI